MRSSIVLGLAALVGLAAALPQPQKDLTATDIYTPSTKKDGFTSKNFTRRGDYGYDDDDYDDDDYDDDDYCVECPPEPCDDHRWKGCLYIECDDCDCDYDDCCSSIGLDKNEPYVPPLLPFEEADL